MCLSVFFNALLEDSVHGALETEEPLCYVRHSGQSKDRERKGALIRPSDAGDEREEPWPASY